MHRTFERVTKARLRFSGGPQAPVNIADPRMLAKKRCFNTAVVLPFLQICAVYANDAEN